MKKNYLKVLAMALMVLCASVAFVSCSDEPKKPHDESKDKLHDDPYKAVLTLVSGHFHGVKFHQDADPEGAKYMKAVQTITFVYTEDKGWAPEAGSETTFRLTSGTKKTVSAYGLWIRYYNKDGEDITGQFIENNQDQIHQHFFIPKNVQPITEIGGIAQADDNEPTALFDYTYMDTTPWNKTLRDEGTKLTGKENPIGFKGYFNFLKDRKSLTLRIKLMHARTSKFKNGKPSPYYKPSNAQLIGDHWDVEIDIPLIIYHSRTEEDSWESDTNVPYDKLRDNEKRIIDAIAYAYGISKQEALDALYLKICGNTSPESGGIWF